MLDVMYRIEWRIISFWNVKENMYAVSNNGWVKNIQTNQILKQQGINSGYLVVQLSCNDKPRKFLIHRLVAFAFIQNDNLDRNTVNHKNGNKHFCEFYNLEWSTQGENNEHAKQAGLNNSYCENHYRAFVTNSQVETICEMLQTDRFSYKEILDSIGLDSSDRDSTNYDLISNIRRGISWTRISKNYIFHKNSGSICSYDQIHEICKCLEEGKDIAYIYNKITGLRYINSTINKKFYEYVRRIKHRQQLTEISSGYVF